ncbi:MAG: ABC transporter ATP-binding protein [Gammaproteobacteria bacterium]
MAPASSDAPIVQIRGLTFHRGGRTIFEDVSLDIERGKVTAIMGPSGTGKTTLLRLIGGALKPHAGTVSVDGLEVAKLSRAQLFELRKRIGMLFQSGALLTDASVFDNVAFPLREHTELPEVLLRNLVLMKLEAVGLRTARDLYPRELSGGMARRVALARAVALDPMMVLYDEPFSGQDPIAMGVLVKLIRDMNDALELTSIVVSHDVGETASIADYIYLISDGKLMGEGTPAELMSATSPWVDQFMHAKPDGPVPFHRADGLHGDFLDDLARAGER